MADVRNKRGNNDQMTDSAIQLKRRRLDITLPEPETVDSSWLTKLVESVVIASDVNAQQRERHPNDPLK